MRSPTGPGPPRQEEFLSSIRYLERAMREFPDEYKYPWVAGARYYFDLWSPDAEVKRRYRERGAELIEQAMTRPNAPQDLATTAANMRSKLGQHQRALDNLRQMVLSTNDAAARNTMLRRVRIANPELAEELEHAARGLQARWLDRAPMVPIDFFILLGEKPSPVIDLRQLATPHDLFGVARGRRLELSRRDGDRSLARDGSAASARRAGALRRRVDPVVRRRDGCSERGARHRVRDTRRRRHGRDGDGRRSSGGARHLARVGGLAARGRPCRPAAPHAARLHRGPSARRDRIARGYRRGLVAHRSAEAPHDRRLSRVLPRHGAGSCDLVLARAQAGGAPRGGRGPASRHGRRGRHMDDPGELLRGATGPRVRRRLGRRPGCVGRGLSLAASAPDGPAHRPRGASGVAGRSMDYGRRRAGMAPRRSYAAAERSSTGPGLRLVVDLDRDGYSSILQGGDCDDLDDSIHPLAVDRPGGPDANCNGVDAPATTTDAARGLAPPSGDPSLPEEAIDRLLLITVDCWRADALDPVLMPEVSAFAAGGMVFERLYAAGANTPGHCRWSSVSDRAGHGSGRSRRDAGSVLTPPSQAQCPPRCGDSAGRGACPRGPTRRRTPRSSSSTPRRASGSCGCTTSISTAWLSTAASRRPRRDRLNCQRAIASACVTSTARSAACSRNWTAAGSSPARWS